MNTKEQDLVLWEKWHRTQNSQDLQALLVQLKPIIANQVNRWGGSLSKSLLEIQGQGLAVKAIKSFDPKRGVALSTHVTNHLQKLSRTVYTHTQAARLPEHKTVGMSSFGAAQEMLQSDLGRPPTSMEMSDHLGWTPKRVGEFQRAFDRKELLDSGEFNPSSFPVADEQDPIVAFVYHDMSPKEQILFEHVTGYGGNTVLGTAALKKKLDLTQGQLSYRKRQLTDHFNKALKQDI